MRVSAAVVAAFVFALVAFNARYFAPAYAVAKDWLGNEEHRLPNIRLVESSCQTAFIREFIAMQDWSLPTFLVLGDSQPFNDRAPLEKTWSYGLASDLGLQHVNMAVIDGRPEDSAYVARLLHEAGVRTEIATLNINHSHFANSGKRVVAETVAYPLDFILCAIQLRREMLTADLPLPGRGGLRQKFRRLPLEADRYDIDLRQAKGVLKEPLENLEQIAERPIAYVTANNIEVFDDYGFDLDRYKIVSRALREICLLTLDECVDASRSLGAGNFYDIVHFNDKGNRYFPGVLKRGMGEQPAATAEVN
jgi:hypothetical protein